MTHNADNAAEEAERRRDDFHCSYGQGGQFESDVLRDCLIAAHRFLMHIADEMAADAAMDALVADVFGGDVEQGGWRAHLDEREGELFSGLLMGQIFHDLNAYAYEGVALTSGASLDDRREYLRNLIVRAERFHAIIPLERWDIEGGDLEQTLMLARGRWALDHDEPIEAQVLAIFGGVSERRIRNMMSKTEGVFNPEGGRIPAREALDWLRGRPQHYRPSLWQVQNPDRPLGFTPGRLEQVVFVPVGSDGSHFHPGLKQDGCFLLGAGEEDIRIADFEAALAELQAMVVPVWRRPTGREYWTRVQGVRWERMTMDQLEASTPGS